MLQESKGVLAWGMMKGKKLPIVEELISWRSRWLSPSRIQRHLKLELSGLSRRAFGAAAKVSV
ncbi:hypothetical protein IC582_023483 [Cucumis melo]